MRSDATVDPPDGERSPDVSSDDLLGGGPGLGLLGIEIGATRVRLVLLDSTASRVTDAVERPIGIGDGSFDAAAEARLQTALLGALDMLGLSEPTPLLMGVTIGMANCGVGSGPALKGWLENLSARLGMQFVSVGDHGVSYAPASAVAFLRRVFEPLPLHLDRIELAPVAACRLIEPLHPGEVTLGSGLAWSARIIGTEVVEAYEITGGADDQVLHLASGGTMRPVEHLIGVEVDDDLIRKRGLELAALAPAVGVAVALHTSPPTNLLAASLVRNPDPAVARTPAGPDGQPAEPLGPDDYRARIDNLQVQPGDRPWDDRAGSWTSPAIDPSSGRLVAGAAAPGRFSDDRYGDRRDLGPRRDPYGDYPGERWEDGAAARAARRPAPSAKPGFATSDFVLGALLMLVVVQVVALVAL